jgi:CRP/FNR family transcriptional regulator, cyclic AMP receptor protein
MTTAIDALRISPLASELTPAEIKVLGDLVTLRSLKDGEVLLPEGARDGHLHVVVRGRIDVLKDGVHGRSLLHTVEPGDLVGELSFMDDEPRYAALVASGPTEVLVLDRRDFETLVDREPRVVYKVMRTIMRVAHKAQRRLGLQMRDLENYLYRTGGKY